jgi:4-hydroxyphenylpyruvate dioxygenase
MMPLAAGRGTVHSHQLGFTNIDHIVLNVEHQTLNTAVRWYQAVLGFHANGWFDIKTDRSALRSQVLVHPQGSAQFPINEPASSGSQIQEFLAANRGPGIQHLALGTLNIVATITHLRQQGLSFLKVPHSYYTQLNQSCPPETPPLDWQAIEQQQILVDLRNPTGILMQAFTHPIFGEPTFFLELIERRSQAQGFGEGNFLALFEAIEREQLKRGSLV